VAGLGLQAVGQAAEGAGEFVAGTADAFCLGGLSLLVALSPGLGGPQSLGDSVTRYLLVFGDHVLAPLTSVPVCCFRQCFAQVPPDRRRRNLLGGVDQVVWVRP
jgi:hypothetical protein